MNKKNHHVREKRAGWMANELEQLRYFKQLPMIDKVRAVEEMCRNAEILNKTRESSPGSKSK